MLIMPSEEELYLLAILDDQSGLDLAEFSWYDPEREDGCYRAWDFQWPWYTCPDTYQVDQGGRALGKTVSIQMRCCVFPFAFPGQNMLITAPELNHLRPLTDAVESRMLSTRIMREMLPQTGKSNGISKQPHWQAKFQNNSMIISRLPNKDGKGVKGQHVIQIELDEAQDYPLAGWIEIVETLNRGLPGAAWRCHGVPKGTRDRFFAICEDGSGWTVHRPMAFYRPNWTAEERQEKTRTYGGSRQAIDYKRNIYGEHGDAANSVFVLSRLMSIVDLDDASIYNSEVYCNIKIIYEYLKSGMSVRNFLDLPGTHLHGYSQRVGTREVGSPKGYSGYYAGMDVGVTNHPSEILVYGQRKGDDTLELLTRVHMQRIDTEAQMEVVDYLFEFYGSGMKAFALDKTGVGFPLWQILSKRSYGNRIYGYNFSEKVVVGFEDRELERGEKQEDLAIQRNVVEATTDWLRNDHVDTKRFRLPNDKEILIEFQGQTYTVVKDTGNPYGTKRLFGGGSFHTLDAAKMVMAGKYCPNLDDMLKSQFKAPPVFEVFMPGGF